MYCPSCGASNAEYGATCSSCGRRLPAASPAVPTQPRGARAVDVGAAPSGSGWRFAAYAALPVIGIFGLAAIPAYRDFAIRAQISEGLELAAPHEAAVVAAWESSGHDFAGIYSGPIDSDLEKRGKYVTSVDIVAGAIVITYGGAVDSALQRRTLTIVPALDESAQSVEWQCGRGPAPEGFVSIFEEPARLTDVPDLYLPSDCRGY
jgi:type IV pilus assembly protein PilA